MYVPTSLHQNYNVWVNVSEYVCVREREKESVCVFVCVVNLEHEQKIMLGTFKH